MVIRMSRVGNCHDNAVAESFFANLKNELTFHSDFQTRQEARSEIFDYIELFYNRKRPHQTLNYASPVEYETMQAVALQWLYGIRGASEPFKTKGQDLY